MRTREEAIRRAAELRELLWENSRLYYVDNSPAISDFEYDTLMRELEDIENEYPELVTPDSPTRKVGSDLETQGTGENAEKAVRRDFEQKAHRYPMLSLANTYSIDEIEEFSERADRLLEGTGFSYCCELKFDGTAICLTYRNGRLVQALTRGDGVMGDDVTENARRIGNIPLKLKGNYPEEFEIRGEILMPYEDFDRLNAEREENSEPPFANPRNAASGSLKLADPDEVAHRGLYCTLYHIPAQSLDFGTHDKALAAAASWGLPVSDKRKICRNIAEIKEYIDHWDTERRSLPYATDGIVIKINEMDAQRTLGYTAKSPRWAVAFKFKAEQACTVLESISYQVGRTGAVTPVANLTPVQLAGTVIRRATLNNADQMEVLDVRVGDRVFVEKGGEIIPKITGVDIENRPDGLEKPVFPEFCPDCGTGLVREEGVARHFCPNSEGCPQQLKGRLLHFMSRKAMNIIGGEALVDQLFSRGLARTPADLYDLSFRSLMTLEGWQERSCQRLLGSLQESRSASFEKVLFAIGIRFVGETTARALARHFGDIDSLMSADKESLVSVPDVGEIIAPSVMEFFASERNVREIERLRAAGLKFSVSVEDTALSAALDGRNIVVSGTFTISRDEIKELIVKHGGTNSSSISSRTSFLLAGVKPGPEKIRKCEQLGIRVVSEEEFFAMLPGQIPAIPKEILEPTLF
ncbi:MAG: NAD-dependent DNA ligase LigA [Bacteroidales bacterium]|nr:NAD-dependent DNA ligase LigA [Bacteroidales bacterium]